MGYEEVNTMVSSFTGENAIKEIEGIYTGSYIHHSTYRSKPTETTVYSFDDGGGVKSVYSKGQLDYKMKNIKVGTWVRVTYLGVEYVEKLDKDVHQFKVEVDKERSLADQGPEIETNEEMPI